MKQINRTFATLLLSVLALTATSVLADEAVWIDVRSQAEYDADHMEDTTLIPHTQIGEDIGKLNLDKSADIKVFCRSGKRAGVAKQTLESLGYTNVENLGGIADARKVREGSDD